MGIDTVGAFPPAARRATPAEPAADPSCSVAVAASVLGALLGRSMSPAEVAETAVGLGLLRLPGPGEEGLLSPAALGRLFLTGYFLPAHVETSSARALQQHLRAGRRAFPLLASAGGRSAAGPVEVFLEPDGAGLLVSDLGGPRRTFWSLPADVFAAAWAGAGQWLAVALCAWAELPAEGQTFFAGGRDRDGTYHWDAAGCATDGRGRILRF